ncbi:MAG: response regulator, partial [Desulfobacteraceae bacterium]|nr:response regulator [Desulfobacteraceae bacterium]
VKLVKSGLEEHGYTVTPYTNGLQALQDFARKPNDFDLVITDMTMPYMTGAELSQKLFEIRPDIPIILCSGYSELINKEKAKAMGFVKYIEKPIILDSLLKTVRDVLDHVAPVSPSNHTGGKH